MKEIRRKEANTKKLQLWWNFIRWKSVPAWFNRLLINMCKLFIEIIPKLDILVILPFPMITSFIFSVALIIILVVCIVCLNFFASLCAFFWMIIIDILHFCFMLIHRTKEYIKRYILHKNKFICPHCHIDIWSTVTREPYYGCPGKDCREIHYNVRSNKYGILFHRCIKCNSRIPAFFSFRKSKLAKYCPRCQIVIRQRYFSIKHIKDNNSIKSYTPIGITRFGCLPHIGICVLGVKGVGKMDFLFSSIQSIHSYFHKRIRFSSADISLKDKNTGELVKHFLEENKKKHSNGNVSAFVWNCKTLFENFFLYVYIPSGKNFEKTDFRFISRLNSIVLVINLESYDGAGDFDEDILFIVGKIRQHLERINVRSGKQLNIPVAIVVYPSEDSSPANARELLFKKDSNLVHLIEHSFRPIRYFLYTLDEELLTKQAAPLLWSIKSCRKLSLYKIKTKIKARS